MTQVAVPQSLPYATPVGRSMPRLAPAVWIAVVGLALIVLGGCFLMGIMGMLAPQLLTSNAIPSPMTGGMMLFMAVLYAGAIGCFSGAVVLLFIGVKLMLRIVNT